MGTPPVLRRLTTPVDALLALALAAAAFTQTVGLDSDRPVLRATLAALTVTSVALRRTIPAAAAAWFAIGTTVESLLTESPDEVGVLIACLLVAFSVAAHSPRRESLLGGALLALGITVTIASDPTDSLGNIAPTLVLFVAIPFALGLAVRARRRDVAALTLEAEALARRADSAVETERRRIARELHDVVSHAVTLIAVQAEAGSARLEADPAAAGRSLAAISQVSREALAELARLLAVLRDDEPDDDVGLANLPDLVEGFRAAGIRVEVEAGDLRDLPGPVDRCAFRLVQESLTNVLRHTDQARASVVAAREGDTLRLDVVSSGRPHTSSYGGSGQGLSGLRERVGALGGTFRAGATPDQGFEVHATLPLAPVPQASP